jgi:hypothetical protein
MPTTEELAEKVERLRSHGLDVVAAVDLVAEQNDLEADMLIMAYCSVVLEFDTNRVDLS